MSCERCDQIHTGPCAEDVVDDQQAEAEAADDAADAGTVWTA